MQQHYKQHHNKKKYDRMHLAAIRDLARTMSGLQVNMTKGSILKSSAYSFSLPILMSNGFQQLYNTMDILIVGNYLGDSSIAAIGASSSIYELLIGFCFGVGSGLSIVVSRYYGYGDKELVKKSVAGAVVIAGCLTAVMMLFSLVGLYPLMPLKYCSRSCQNPILTFRS